VNLFGENFRWVGQDPGHTLHQLQHHHLVVHPTIKDQN
jgi:hypothetical protein